MKTTRNKYRFSTRVRKIDLKKNIINRIAEIADLDNFTVTPHIRVIVIIYWIGTVRKGYKKKLRFSFRVVHKYYDRNWLRWQITLFGIGNVQKNIAAHKTALRNVRIYRAVRSCSVVEYRGRIILSTIMTEKRRNGIFGKFFPFGPRAECRERRDSEVRGRARAPLRYSDIITRPPRVVARAYPYHYISLTYRNGGEK